MPHVVSIVGGKDSGKTTLLEKIVLEFKKRNFKVGTIKHHKSDFEIDVPGKDSWRHACAGADVVAISSPERFALVARADREKSIDEIVALMGEMDIVFTEGYKGENKPKIEIFRPSEGRGRLLSSPDELVAVVTDAPVDPGVPVFGLEDTLGLTDYLERLFLTGRGAKNNER